MRFGSGSVARMEGSRMMLADFGLACAKAEAQRGLIRADMINSLAYRPPELIDKGRRRVSFGAEVDVWAASATAYDCASWGNPEGPKIYMLHYFFKHFENVLSVRFYINQCAYIFDI